MDKRYQVFVSSTYADLKEERQKVIQALMEMDCIPAGMELFPAADEEQWEFIKKVIADCDYYVLIIGGRYGSTTSEGISYTEKEYEFALERGLKVLAFVHSSPDELAEDRRDADAALCDMLASFRERVAKGRLVKMWTKADELPGLVALSLNKTIKTYPAIGWVRGDQATNPELLKQLNDVRKQNAELQSALKAAISEARPAIENLADLDETVKFTGTYSVGRYGGDWECTTSWGMLFTQIAPQLMGNPSEAAVQILTAKALLELSGKIGQNAHVPDSQFQTAKVQLMAQGLVDVQYLSAVGGGVGLFWLLTPKGKALMFQRRTIKSADAR